MVPLRNQYESKKSSSIPNKIVLFLRNFLSLYVFHVPDVSIPNPSLIIFLSIPDVLPGNFIAVGDAHCALNPIYGQGWTMDCVAAVTLDHILRTTTRSTYPQAGATGPSPGSRWLPRRLFRCSDHPLSGIHHHCNTPRTISSRYFPLIQSRFQEVWFWTRALDYQRKSCVAVLGDSKRHWTFDFCRYYIRRLCRLAQYDAKIQKIWYTVLGMEEQSWALFSPDIVKQVYECEEPKPPLLATSRTKGGRHSSMNSLPPP
jgi:hypothetical protein